MYLLRTTPSARSGTLRSYKSTGNNRANSLLPHTKGLPCKSHGNWISHIFANAQGARADSAPNDEAPAVAQRNAVTAPASHKGGALRLRQRMSAMSGVALPLLTLTVSGGSGTGSESADIYMALAKAVRVYMAVLTVRILASWFPNLNWHSEPLNTLRQLTDPYLNIFRGIIPPLGAIDVSPILAFFLLSFLARYLMGMAY